MKPISVVVPVYNRINVLERCVKSIQAQSFLAHEIILVDDGSTDGSTELCFSLSRKDKRIKCVHIPHQGASAARNAGLIHAKGDYIIFLDSDDVISSDMLQRMYDNINQTGAEISCCRFKLEDNSTPFVSTRGQLEVLNVREAFEKMLLNDNDLGYGVSTGTKLIKRSLLMEPYPLYFREDVTFGEDAMWIVELLERVTNVAMDSSVMMRYSVDCENSICRTIPITERIKHTRWKMNYLKEHGYTGKVVESQKVEERYLVMELLQGHR